MDEKRQVSHCKLPIIIEIRRFLCVLLEKLQFDQMPLNQFHICIIYIPVSVYIALFCCRLRSDARRYGKHTAEDQPGK